MRCLLSSFLFITPAVGLARLSPSLLLMDGTLSIIPRDAYAWSAFPDVRHVDCTAVQVKVHPLMATSPSGPSNSSWMGGLLILPSDAQYHTTLRLTPATLAARILHRVSASICSPTLHPYASATCARACPGRPMTALAIIAISPPTP